MGRQKLNIILLNKMFQKLRFQNMYRKFASSNMTRLGAHAGFIKLLIKGMYCDLLKKIKGCLSLFNYIVDMSPTLMSPFFVKKTCF